MSKTPLLGLLPVIILAGALCAERSAVASVIDVYKRQDHKLAMAAAIVVAKALVE